MKKIIIKNWKVNEFNENYHITEEELERIKNYSLKKETIKLNKLNA